MSTPRYLVGIDLGTTNSVVAYCENSKELKSSPVEIFEIDQLAGPGEVVRRPQLPSFRYHPAHGQISPGDRQLPWENQLVAGDFAEAIIGEWARNLGAQVEGRQVSSAKSWLSHQAVDRTEAILPWSGAEDSEKVSPLVASASYLNHMRQSWNFHHPGFPLEQQEVVVTVPASFDESARKLTIEAAALAGLDNILLLEEPQAVFYDWYARFSDQADEKLEDVPLILVCDVGGGTTDLSLISAQHGEQGLKLDRIGVGEHLMLGGDNIDLALAHLTEQRINSQNKLSAARLSKLIQQTRQAKESLLVADAPDNARITLLGSGSKLLGGTKSVALSKQEVQQLAVDGFFPFTEPDELPSQRSRAVIEFGLPYVSDPAVSRHVAQFLAQHQEIAAQANPTSDSHIPVGLLLNGGVFNSPLIKARMQQILERWKGNPVTLLDNPHPDLSVALGAVSYAKARRGAQLKIGGGVARSYFLQLAEKGKDRAICLLAKGTEESQEIRLTSRRFALTLDEPVRFNLLTTTHDHIHPSTPIQNGLLTEVNTEQFHPLPPYVTSLQSGQPSAVLAANQKQRIEVFLASQLTTVGTLQLECVSVEDSSQRWRVEFEVRKHKSSDKEESPSKSNPNLEQALELITQLYSGNKANKDNSAIKRFNKDLERLLGQRDNWDFATLRTIYDTLAKGKKRRRRSDLHEKHWLRLAGFTLRPGFGDAVDEWRVKQLWEIYNQSIQFQDHQSWSDWWTCWRRVSGGLDQEQQEQILAAIAKYLHPGAHRGNKANKEAHENGYDAMVRLSASLEHLEVEDKTLLANWFISRAQNMNDFRQTHWWAVGRLASRQLFYGSAHKVIGRAQVEQWLEKLLQLDWKQDQMLVFAVVMMSRKTGDRSLDISEPLRERILEQLAGLKIPVGWLELVKEVTELDQGETKRLFGDSLPSGLVLLKE